MPPFSGCIAMRVMLIFTSSAHLFFVKGMAMMIAPFIHFKKQLVWLTGILELMGGISLLFVASQANAAVGLMIFFLLMLPANIYAAI